MGAMKLKRMRVLYWPFADALYVDDGDVYGDFVMLMIVAHTHGLTDEIRKQLVYIGDL